MKNYIIVFFLAVSFSSFAQSSLSNYEYLLVPKQFEIFDEANKYGLNTMTSLFFEQQGFKVFYDDNVPSDLANNSCLGLKAKLEERKGLFKTRVTVLLKNCYGNTVWQSKEGESSEKAFPTAYRQALRFALKSFEAQEYMFDPTLSETTTLPISPKVDEPNNQMNSGDSEVLEVEKNETKPNKSMYELAMTKNGFSLYDSDTKSFVGSGLKSEISETYHFTSANIQGIAVFNDNQVTVEYYKDGEVVSKTYLLQ